jgi:hypothetical protein
MNPILALALAVLVALLSGCGLAPYNQDYLAAKRIGTVEAYRAYLLKYPDSPLKSTTLKSIDDIERRERARAEVEQRRMATLERARATEDIDVMLALGDSLENIAAVVRRAGKKVPEELDRLLRQNFLPALSGLRPPFAGHMTVNAASQDGARPLIGTFVAPRYYPDRAILYFRSATVNEQRLGRMILIGDQFFELP